MKSSFNIGKIPRDIGYYLAGFVDGEGSFYCVIRERRDYHLGFKFTLCFNVSNRDLVILSLLKKHLACGTIRQRVDGCYIYQVESFEMIKERVIPFFKTFSFLSAKKKQEFTCYKKLALLVESKIDSIEKVRSFLQLRDQLGDFRIDRFKYTDSSILEIISQKMKESPETIR